MNKKPSVDELQSLFDVFKKEIKLIVRDEIRETLKEITREPPRVIKEIIEALQLNSIPINGKYSPASGDYKQFIYWIVDNNYDEILTEDIFLHSFTAQ